MSQLLGAVEPRIWTPPLRELTPATSLGFEVIDVARDVMGLELYPAQEWVLVHGLELHPDYTTDHPAPVPRFDTVLVMAARQNGKTEVSKPLTVWTLTVDQPGSTVIGTSQDLAAARKTWLELLDLITEVDELHELVDHADKTNGRETLRMLDGGQYLIRAASRRAARSFTGERVLLDELREHMNWEAWAAATKTAMARPRSQTWAFSNAGDVRSVVLRHLRLLAMESAVGVEPGELEAFRGPVDPAAETEQDPEMPEDHGSIALFEYSATPGRSKWDRRGWAQANWSLNRGGVTERKIAAAAALDPEWSFRTEVLCQWPTGVIDGVFPPGAWDQVQDPDSRPAPGAPRVFAVDVAPDQSWAAIAAAAEREDGLTHLQVVDHHRGDSWVVDRVVQLRKRWGGHGQVVLCGRMAAGLKDQLEKALRAAEDVADDAEDLVVVMSGRDVISATGGLYRAVVGTPEHEEDGELVPAQPPTVRFPAQAAITESVEGAQWKELTDGRIFARRGGVDICPVYASLGALWGLQQLEEEPDYDVLESAW